MIHGKHPTLLSVKYVKPETISQRKESFQIIYADDDNVPHFSEEPANADIYIVKPEFRTYDYNKPEERIDHCDKVRVPISKIRYEIAKQSGDWGKQIVEAANAQHNFSLLNQLYRWPYAYGCDFQPEYYYMKNWYEKYELKTPHLTKAFMDIEVDMMDYVVDMEHVESSAYAPVNLITVIFEEDKEAWTFILRPYVPPKSGRTDEEYNKRYDMYRMQLNDHEYLMTHLEEFYNTLHQSFDETYGYLTYHLRDYEQEIDLIADAFRLINTKKPNFCMIWNMRFDIAYLIARIQVLGYEPKSVICHPDIPYPTCLFRKDNNTFMITKQFDAAYITSYTQYLCQMRTYASIRKSQHTLRSLKLNTIADIELKDKKVEYPDQTNIATFPYVDWIKFCQYNIKDVLLQLGIERKTNDLMTYYMRSHANLTPYNKIFRETHLVRNVREIYFEKEGWVQGNNLNILSDTKSDEEKKFYGYEEDEDESSTFKGAINADPVWNDYVGEEILGRKTNNIFKNAVDMDFGAMYPSVKIASNMDPQTLIYKASLDNNEFLSGEFQNNSVNQNYEEQDKFGKWRKNDLTGEVINTFASGNILTLGYDWLGLPDVAEMREMVLDIVKKK